MAKVETLVEEEAVGLEEGAAAVVKEEAVVDIMDLEVMVVTRVVALVTVVEKAMVVGDQDVQTKMGDMMVMKDMMITRKEEILVLVTLVMAGAIMILKATGDSSAQIMP